MIDENNVPKRRGRKKKSNMPVTQHSVYVEDDLWEEADNLPISRPDIVRQAFINAIAFYKSDLPKLKWQLEEKLAQKLAIESEIAIIETRIKELEEAQEIASIVKQKTDKNKEAAVSEMIRLCRVFKKKLTHEHFLRISALSGIEPAEIEVFLSDINFRPTEEAARAFIMR